MWFHRRRDTTLALHQCDDTPPGFETIRTPSAATGLRREARIWADLAGGIRHLPQALLAARGCDEAVLLLPGFTAGDGSTWLLRRFLSQLGWDARGWGLGTNGGDAPGLLLRATEVAERIVHERGKPLHRTASFANLKLTFVPEPSTLLLFGGGALVLFGFSRRS